MRYSPKIQPIIFSNLFSSSACVALALMCIGLFSCSSNTSVSPSKVSAVGIEQFPMAVGDSWTYAVFDSLGNTLDTVSVTVEGPGADLRQFSSVWVFKGTSYHDTMYVLVENSSVMMFEDPRSLQTGATITFPLVEGASWGKSPDSTVVYSATDVSVPAGTFDNAFRVDRHAVGFNYRLDSQRWIVPDIGIVQWDRTEFNLGPALNQRWVLMSYKRF